MSENKVENDEDLFEYNKKWDSNYFDGNYGGPVVRCYFELVSK